MGKTTSSRIFVISDSHFSHKNILDFKDGEKPVRPFSSVEEMNEAMIENWNNAVTDNDIVFHIGDVVFAQTGFECLGRLKGKKTLIMGNHERHKLSKYLEYFEDVRAYKEYGDMIMSHIPLHTRELGRWKANIHGHLHTKNVMIEVSDMGSHRLEEDRRYFCVSVEQINYTPMLLKDIVEVFKCRGVL